MITYDEFMEALKNYNGTNERVKAFARLMTDETNYTAEEIRKLNNDTLYFTKKELFSIMDKEFRKPDYRDVDIEIIDLCLDTLDKGLYFETIEEAETHFDEVIRSRGGGK